MGERISADEAVLVIPPTTTIQWRPDLHPLIATGDCRWYSWCTGDHHTWVGPPRRLGLRARLDCAIHVARDRQHHRSVAALNKEGQHE